MSLRREVSFEVSFVDWLLGNRRSAAGVRAARSRNRAASYPAKKKAEATAKTGEEIVAGKNSPDQASGEPTGEGEVEAVRKEHVNAVADKLVEALNEEGYEARRGELDGLPGIVASRSSGEQIFVAVDADGKALLDLDGFKGRDCHNLMTRLDAQMAKRGMLVAGDRTESKAAAERRDERTDERKHACAGE